jgi:hypothetical protein
MISNMDPIKQLRLLSRRYLSKVIHLPRVQFLDTPEVAKDLTERLSSTTEARDSAILARYLALAENNKLIKCNEDLKKNLVELKKDVDQERAGILVMAKKLKMATKIRI